MPPENQQQQDDHNLIIRIDERVKSGFDNVNAAIDRLENGLYIQITDHEKRIKHIEDRALRLNLETVRSDIDKIESDWGGFRSSLRIYAVVAGIIGTFIIWLVQQTIIKMFFK